MLLGRCAQQRVRIPEHGGAVHQRRHLAVGIELEVGRILGVVELPPVILAGVGRAQFFQQENDLLDIAGRFPAEKPQHLSSPSRYTNPAGRILRPLRYPRRGLYATASISILHSMTARASTVVRLIRPSGKYSANTLL